MSPGICALLGHLFIHLLFVALLVLSAGPSAQLCPPETALEARGAGVRQVAHVDWSDWEVCVSKGGVLRGEMGLPKEDLAVSRSAGRPGRQRLCLCGHCPAHLVWTECVL